MCAQNRICHVDKVAAKSVTSLPCCDCFAFSAALLLFEISSMQRTTFRHLFCSNPSMHSFTFERKLISYTTKFYIFLKFSHMKSLVNSFDCLL